MLKRRICIAALCMLGGFSALFPQDMERALEIARQVERVAGSRVLWPGFEPMAIPLAIYDGKRTYLFRHPAPPAGFSLVAGALPAVYAYSGRYPAVTSNTSEEIGGTVTATLMADGTAADGTPVEMAAVSLHEAFHVFQRERHSGWAGNEGDLLLYPADDARLLGLRRLETEALRRALAEPDRAVAACWTRQALAFRRERFAAANPTFAEYEQKTELNEGLASYIQLLAAGRTAVEIPAAEFRPAEIRLRAYTIGPALALLLDRFRPGWQASLETDDQQRLDTVLEAAVAKGDAETSSPCAFTAAETANLERAARDSVAALQAERAERRKAFDGRPGWRVVVQAAEGQPLWPKSFDPLNIERVEGGLLHTRFLRLGNDSGQFEAIDGEGADLESFTESLGRHPLFQGIKRVVIAGLAKPEIKTEGGAVDLQAPGFSARFENARAEIKETEAVIQLMAAEASP